MNAGLREFLREKGNAIFRHTEFNPPKICECDDPTCAGFILSETTYTFESEEERVKTMSEARELGLLR
jgi:hypothetical protein